MRPAWFLVSSCRLLASFSQCSALRRKCNSFSRMSSSLACHSSTCLLPDRLLPVFSVAISSSMPCFLMASSAACCSMSLNRFSVSASRALVRCFSRFILTRFWDSFSCLLSGMEPLYCRLKSWMTLFSVRTFWLFCPLTWSTRLCRFRPCLLALNKSVSSLPILSSKALAFLMEYMSLVWRESSCW